MMSHDTDVMEDLPEKKEEGLLPEQPNFSDFGLFELPIKTIEAFLQSDAEDDACMTFTKLEMQEYIASLQPSPTEYD